MLYGKSFRYDWSLFDILVRVYVCVSEFIFDKVLLFLCSLIVHNNTVWQSGEHEGDNTFCTDIHSISRCDVQKALLLHIHHVWGLNLGSDIGCHEWSINVTFHYPSS